MTNPGAATTSTSVYGNTGGNPAAVGTGTAQSGVGAAGTVGFFGATPVVQPTNANEAAVLTVAAVTVAGYSFVTAGQANGIVTLLNQLRADLVTLGLIKGS